ncbi:hypothetical protein BsWGS_25438 [Bradybaena similaris]
MKSALAMASILTMSVTVLGALCDFDSCEQQVCPEVTRENCKGRFVKKGSVCLACCDVCYHILAPGATCFDLVINEMNKNKDEYVYQECSKGYYCDYMDTWTCVKSR